MSFLGKIFGEDKGQSVLGVDVGSSSIKVVQLRKKQGTIVLETYGELALGPYGNVEVGQATNLPAETINKALVDLLREANVTTTNCGISIPASRSLLIFIELPYREDQAEQKTVIELEARKYVPIPVNEVHLDWFILPDTISETNNKEKDLSKKRVKVLLIAVHNDELKLLENVVQKSGLTASFYEIEIFSTIRSVIDEPVKPVMVIDIGASSTKVYIVERGIVSVSHAIPHGGQDVTRAISTSAGIDITHAELLKKKSGLSVTQGEVDNSSTIEHIFSQVFAEAKRVLIQFETAHSRSVSTIILTGGGGVTKGLGQYAQTFFSVETRVADPFGKTQAPAFIRPVLKEIGPEFSVAVGIALRKLEEFS